VAMAKKTLDQEGLYLEIPGLFGAPAAPEPAPELPPLPAGEEQMIRQYADQLLTTDPASIKGSELKTLKKLTRGYAGWEETVSDVERRYEMGRVQKSLGVVPPPLPESPAS